MARRVRSASPAPWARALSNGLRHRQQSVSSSALETAQRRKRHRSRTARSDALNCELSRCRRRLRHRQARGIARLFRSRVSNLIIARRQQQNSAPLRSCACALKHRGHRFPDFYGSGQKRHQAKFVAKATNGRGESGWCSDVTSTHGAWRHAGVRFSLSGESCSHLVRAPFILASARATALVLRPWRALWACRCP